MRNYQPGHKKAVGRSIRSRRQDAMNLYDTVWETYRLKYLAINNKCYACGEKSQVVDHLIPHKGCQVLFKKLDNHIPLCTSCHNRITALFDKHYRPGNPITNKLSFMKNERVKRDLTFRVKVLPTYP